MDGNEAKYYPAMRIKKYLACIMLSLLWVSCSNWKPIDLRMIKDDGFAFHIRKGDGQASTVWCDAYGRLVARYYDQKKSEDYYLAYEDMPQAKRERMIELIHQVIARGEYMGHRPIIKNDDLANYYAEQDAQQIELSVLKGSSVAIWYMTDKEVHDAMFNKMCELYNILESMKDVRRSKLHPEDDIGMIYHSEAEKRQHYKRQEAWRRECKKANNESKGEKRPLPPYV